MESSQEIDSRKATERTDVHVDGKQQSSCNSPDSDEISGNSHMRPNVCDEEISYKIASFRAEQKLNWTSEELLQKSNAVECTSLQMFICCSQMWCQMKQSLPHCAQRLATFQDSEAEAPISHQFVMSLAAQGPQTLLGIREWPCSENSQLQQTVRLHIECVAAGTQTGDASVNRLRHEIRKMLAKEFSPTNFPGPVMAGRNLRHDKEKKMPLNLDHRSALHVALLDESNKVIGAAVVYVHGPGFGYLPFFMISDSHRGQGLGSRFAGALIGVLRHLNVDAVLVEASVKPVTREQHVVRFWEDKVGFARATDEYYDEEEKLTNSSRHRRVSGWAVREMSGVYGFPDSCIMFRGTKSGWKLGDSDVELPMLSSDAAVCCSIGAVHGDMCQLVDVSAPGSCVSGELRPVVTIVGRKGTSVHKAVQTSWEVNKQGWPAHLSSDCTTKRSIALFPSEGATIQETDCDVKHVPLFDSKAPSADVATGETDNKCGVLSTQGNGASEEDDDLHYRSTLSIVAESKSANMTRVHLNTPVDKEIKAVMCASEGPGTEFLTPTNTSHQTTKKEKSAPELSPGGKKCWMSRIWHKFVQALPCGCPSAGHSEKHGFRHVYRHKSGCASCNV